MRPSLAISLVFLSLLLSGTECIRLDTGLSSLLHINIHVEDNMLHKTSNGGAGDVSACKDGHCSTAGKIRKLITATMSASTTPSKNKKSDEGIKGISKQQDTIGVQEKSSKNSVPNSENQEAPANENNPESNVEIAVMDYSPASRKPPIHN